MTTPGTVRAWRADEGWGVLDSVATPGGCWAHGSAVLVPGHRVLEHGRAVEFTFEVADQDGYALRAVAVWPAGQEPVADEVVRRGSAAHRSRLRLTFDGDEGRPAP
jgi:CspA family cold shock protein